MIDSSGGRFRLRHAAILIAVFLTFAMAGRSYGDCFPNPTGLIGWWPGDGSAINLLGTNSGTLQGGATASTPGTVGTAFNFDGTNGYVQVPNSPVLQPTNLTIECWVKFSALDSAGTSPAGDQFIVFKQNTRSTDFEGVDLSKTRVSGSDYFRFLIASASGQTALIRSATAISTGVWYHVAAVRGSNFTQLYVNGVLERQTNVTFAQNYGNFPLYFGTSGQATWDRKLKGNLDEVALYDRALASNEIAAVFAAGAAGKCKAPNLTIQPQSQAVLAGSNVTFTVAATGFGALTYQWRSNNVAIARATNSSLALSNAQPPAANYSVAVANSLGSVTSAVAVLTFLTPPAINVQPASQSVVPGANVAFSSVVTGGEPLFYRWYFNDVLLSDDVRHSGSAAATLVISNVVSADEGKYVLVVTNAAGSAMSSNAFLKLARPPFAHTQAAGPITTTNAVLNGMVVPNGADTIAWFEWGTDSNYGQTTVPVSVGNGFTVVRVSAGISNLPPVSTFHCRLVVSNSFGVMNAASILFTSGQRVTQWGVLSSGLLPMPSGLTNVVAADNGYYHNVVLTTAGKVIAWGYNEYGQTDVPAGLSNVIAVSAGLYHEAALRSDGRVAAWGRNDAGQTNVPAGLSNVVAISAGYYHTLALKQDGTLAGWGDNGNGQLNFPASLSNVVAIAAGGYSGLALRAEGTVVAWGSTAAVPEGISNVVAISAGYQGLVIKSDGSVVVVGGDTNIPANLGKVVSVSSGYYHSLALNETGKVFAWGIDYRSITNVPPELTNAVAIAGDGYHSLALGNLPPQAFAQHLTGVAGQDQTIVLTGADPNNDELNSRITALPSSGTLYQWTSGGRGDPITAPDTLVADTGNRVILSQPVVADDTFAFTMNDGLQDSSAANIQVDIRPARLFTQRPQPAGVSSITLCGNLIAAVPTTAWFEWGAFGGYGQSTAPIALNGDGSLMHVTTLLTNLAERANFQCRLVVSNQFGVSYGMPVLFTTGRKMYGWGSNSNGQLDISTNLTNVVFAAAGWYNSFAIRADGTALGWGWNSFGQAMPLAGLTNAVDIAAGYYHGLALKSDGTVVAWGNNDWGQTNVPAGLSGVVDVSAGYAHSLALKSDGTVVTWGEYASASQTNQPPGLNNVVAIAGGNLSDIALKADGTVVSWGTDNGGGQTVIPAGLMDVVAIAAGEYHCLALRSDGTVAAWGKNTSGQATVPPGLSNVVAVSAGGNQSVALKADGTIVAWGSITTAKGNVVAGLTNVVLVANGYGHGLALGNLMPLAQSRSFSGLGGQDVTATLQGSDPDGDALRFRIATLPVTGSLYQWTFGGRGSLITTNNTWVEDSGGRVIYAQPLSGSESFTFVANDGLVDSTNATASITISPAWVSTQPTRPAGTSTAVLCGTAAAASPTMIWFEWGLAGGYGQKTAETVLSSDGKLAQLSAVVTNLAVRVNYQCRLVASNASGVVYGAPMLFTTGRKVVGWGRNNFAQTNVPISLSNVVSVAAGVNHSLALKSDGSVAAWGFGTNGETNVPAGLANVVAVDGGANHSLALKADGTVVVWGLGSSLTNVPTGLSNVVAVAAGYYHILALRSDGTVAAWGANTFDQFPSGQTNVPPGLSNVVSVAAGGGHSLALKADGTVVAWGYNGLNAINVPAGLSNVVAVAAGRNHNLALRANGTFVAWGNSRNGQTTIPVSVSNVVAVAAGENQSFALRADGVAVAWGDNFYGQASILAGLSNIVALSGGGFHNLALGNLPPQAQSQTSIGLLGQDLTLTLPASDPNYDTMTRRVASLPATGNLYQWTSAGRGAAITAPNTVVTDLQGRVVFAPGAIMSGWPYTTFTFFANDGEADSTTAILTLNLTSAPVIDVSSLSVGTNGVFSLSFSGDTNASYRVWASTNLVIWEVLGPATPASNGWFQFFDLNSAHPPQRFYRAGTP